MEDKFILLGRDTILNKNDISSIQLRETNIRYVSRRGHELISAFETEEEAQEAFEELIEAFI